MNFWENSKSEDWVDAAMDMINLFLFSNIIDTTNLP